MSTQTSVPIEQHKRFAHAVENVARALSRLFAEWPTAEPAFYTAETGYPFTASLDEVADATWAWFYGVAGDVDVREGRA